jgi:hypothetical protein
MKKPVRKPTKPRKSPKAKVKVVKSVKAEKVLKSKKVKEVPEEKIHQEDWHEKMPRKTHKTNKFCVGCASVETCVKEKLASIMFCGDKT